MRLLSDVLDLNHLGCAFQTRETSNPHKFRLTDKEAANVSAMTVMCILCKQIKIYYFSSMFGKIQPE